MQRVCLALLLLFGFFLLGKADLVEDYEEHNEDIYTESIEEVDATTALPNKVTERQHWWKSSTTEENEEEDDSLIRVSSKTTTATTTKSHSNSDDLDVEYPDGESDEIKDDEVDHSTTSTTNLITPLSSSSSRMITTSNTALDSTTKMSTTPEQWVKRNVSSTHWSELLLNGSYDDIHWLGFRTTTIDGEKLAELLRKISRDRLLLKIFAIFIIVFTTSMAVILFIIHLKRKTKRYRGYRMKTSPASGGETLYIKGAGV